jgi:hypothetical protein
MAVISPYDEVEWSTVEHHLSQFHLHEPRNAIDECSPEHDPAHEAVLEDGAVPSDPGELIRKYNNVGYTVLAVTEHEYFVDGAKHKGQPYFDGLDVTSWPWSRWDADADDLDMVAVQGAELRVSIDGLDQLHDLLSLNNDIGHARGRSAATVLESIEERGGVGVLPHPGKYFDPEQWEAYASLFRNQDSLLGIEIYNARDRYPNCRPLWDALLTQFGSNRPIWGFANDDYHAKRRAEGEERFDQSRNVLLLSEFSLKGVMSALRRGQFYVQHNGNGTAPMIDEIESTEDSISVRSSESQSVHWIAQGEVVGTGETISLETLNDYSYARAELTGEKDAMTCTQPIYTSR